MKRFEITRAQFIIFTIMKYCNQHEFSSTPLRIVFNSSASYMGQKLNEFWAKGPDILQRSAKEEQTATVLLNLMRLSV